MVNTRPVFYFSLNLLGSAEEKSKESRHCLTPLGHKDNLFPYLSRVIPTKTRPAENENRFMVYTPLKPCGN
jgi:hypothetical protein